MISSDNGGRLTPAGVTRGQIKIPVNVRLNSVMKA